MENDLYWLIKNGMDCLSKQWAFMMQGDICMGREVVRSKPFTRWLGSCREAVLYRAGRNEIATSKRQRKGKMNCQDKRYRCIYNRSWKLPVFLASTDKKKLWQCSRTVISTCILYGTGPECTGVHQVFPTVPHVHGDWWKGENKRKFKLRTVLADEVSVHVNKSRYSTLLYLGLRLIKQNFLLLRKMGRMPKGSSFN